MIRRWIRLLAFPFYLTAILFLATWQTQLSNLEKPETKTALPLPDPDPDQEPGLEILGDSQFRLLNADSNESHLYAGEPKVIVSWNGEFSQAHLSGCPDWNCRLTSDRSGAERSDAIIFYNGAGDHPQTRPQSQYYVFFTLESPLHMSITLPYKNFYNLSMSFRRDSDIPCPYGFSVKKNVPLSQRELESRIDFSSLKKKDRLVAWFVSNCAAPSRRDAYVAALQKFLPVHVYGSCGTYSCPKEPKYRCRQLLEEHYWFYLAFENSVCRDYVTEKFWEKSAVVKIVPIVLKRSLLESTVPPKSFIAADDFQSPLQLAEYLRYLSKNFSAYMEYFAWRKKYEIIFLDGEVHDFHERPWGFCRLCHLLWKTSRPTRILNDPDHWWSASANCDNSLVGRIS